MIDFHSHILPAMDDGSKNEQESIAMLTELKNQGITRVIATPHFYANGESVSAFLSRRQKSFEKLNLNSDFPQVVLGAEVRYYEGISRLADLTKLCISGTDLLLLEMPSAKWTDFVIKELISLASNGNITLVLAHIERYIFMQPKSVFADLLNSGVLMQINASFINGFFTRRKALKLLGSDMAHFVGSDCHNTTDRAPEMKSAVSHITKGLGEDFLHHLVNYGNEFFCKDKDHIYF